MHHLQPLASFPQPSFKHATAAHKYSKPTNFCVAANFSDCVTFRTARGGEEWAVATRAREGSNGFLV